MNYQENFPYAVPRKEQRKAIEFALKEFIESDKRFVIIEAGTGVGKSAIGLTLARCLQKEIQDSEKYEPGSYFLTTQKILQKQYEKDFGGAKGEMKSIYSSSNYKCRFYNSNDCRTTLEMMRSMDPASNPGLFKCCGGGCNYKQSKIKFLKSEESVTNFPYFLTEATYSGGITPRKVLVVDEAHNVENVLSSFIEISVSQFFCEKIVKAKWPDKITNVNFVKWLRNIYFPKLQSQIMHFEQQIDNLGIDNNKLKELSTLATKYDLLKGHSSKIEKFLKNYDKDNWIMEKQETEKRGYVKVVYRAVDISNYAEEYLFRLGQKVIMMSATILNADAYAESLGLKKEEYSAISLPSPFPRENRPIISAQIGLMSSREIDKTLPQLKKAVEAILNEHKGQKGIIHTHTYKIANYLRDNIKGPLKKRILTHNSKDRDEVLKKHMTSKKDTVLISPSMTEGVDLKGDLSKFQIICKVPYPWLGDPIVKKRMYKFPDWYPLQTAMTVVQSVGRSIRNNKDTAVTYILDSDWERFYRKNKKIFSEDFRQLLK